MGMPPYPAMTIAKWFIAWAEAEDEELSNMKLQKLLYYAQGHHLAAGRGPLFADEIQAWSHGPVVAPLYRAFKAFGSGTIQLKDSDPFTWQEVDPSTAEFLGQVWNTYGGYSAGRLRAMTHEEPPWKGNFRDGDRSTQIPPHEMERYFRHIGAAH
jgi:uncharacterized phage-associated protein